MENRDGDAFVMVFYQARAELNDLVTVISQGV